MPRRGVAVAGAAAAVELGGEGADRRREPGSERGGECDRAPLRAASQPALCVAQGAEPDGKQSGGSRGPAPLDFVPVVVTEERDVARASAIEIELSGARVRVSAGIDPTLLENVLRTLKALG